MTEEPFSDDRFIPIRYHELADELASVHFPSGDGRERFLAVAERIWDVILQEATWFEARLADAYATFNPDRDTLTREQVDPEARQAARDRLTGSLQYLFGKANFEPVTEDELLDAVTEANTQGLRLTLDESQIDEISLFFRGKGIVSRKERSWRTRFRMRDVDTPVYRRFAVVVRLHDDPSLYLKLFKNIPRMDIEALLPHAQVAMNLIDRFKLAGSGAGAIGGSLWKLVQLVGGAATKLAAIWSQLLWVLLVGLVMLAVRTFTGYRNIRTHRDALRTRNLYFQNLDNNAGVVHSLVAMVCEEEAKEAVLAYALCLSTRTRTRDKHDLDARVEAFLRERYGARMNFEIADAVETLTRLKLWSDEKAFTALDPQTAETQLTEHWRTRATADYHERMARRGQ